MGSPVLFEYLGAHRQAGNEPYCPVLLVGEDNPLSGAPEHALYPYPPGCAGHRLAVDILQVGEKRQLQTWRTNLCNPTWSAKAARERARSLVVAEGVPWRVIVMLGRKVAGAFETALDSVLGDPISIPPFEKMRVIHRVLDGGEIDWITLVSLPHPSGRNRIWNNLGQRERARQLAALASPEWYAPEGRGDDE